MQSAMGKQWSLGQLLGFPCIPKCCGVLLGVGNGDPWSVLSLWASKHWAGRGAELESVWFPVSARSMEELGERRPSPGGLGTALCS